MIETHPFESFIPYGTKYLILGSFAAKQYLKDKPFFDENYDFFYCIKKNQFWPILGEVYGRQLMDTPAKKSLLAELKIAIADIIYQCERKSGSSLDGNLINPVYAIDNITRIFETNQIIRVFFTSQNVERKFLRNFKAITNRHPTNDLVTLPSPSPRNTHITMQEKIRIYKEQLPRLTHPLPHP